MEESLGDPGKSTQAKRLQLRKARFRAPAVPSANATPAAVVSHHRRLSSSNLTCSTTPDENSSPLNARAKHSTNLRASGDLGILQEISNSSLRGTRRSVSYGEFGVAARTGERQTSVKSPLDSTLTLSPLGPSPPHRTDIDVKRTGRRVSKSRNAADRSASKASTRNRCSTGSSRRSLTSDNTSSGYVEHLEHQIALLEAHIQSLTSPSKNKTQSTKLRALSSEAKLLRQEVADWETKFDERVRESIEEHESLIGSLRAQIRAMKKVSTAADADLEGLRTENEDKAKQLEAAELLNQDLEKRLELMSDLLASSPTKLRFGEDVWGEAVRRTPKQPLRRPPFSPTLSLQTSGLYSNPQSPAFVPPSPSPSTTLGELSDSTDLITQEVSEKSIGSELIEDVSEQDSLESPNRRRWTTQLSLAGSATKPRPSRRMRRFHGSCAGPRALILPATAYQSSFAFSAPNSVLHTPDASADDSCGNPPPHNLHSQPSDIVENAERPVPTENEQVVALQSENEEQRAEQQMSLSPPHSPSMETTPHAAEYESGNDTSTIASSLNRESILPNHSTSLFDELAELEDRSIISDSTSKPNAPNRPKNDDMLEETPDSMKSMVLYQSKLSSLCCHPNEAVQSPLASRNLPLPLRILNGLTNATARTLADRTPRVKLMLINAWSVIALSKPVLEFRWWLVKLLVGDYYKRSQLLQPFEVGLGSNIPPDPGEEFLSQRIKTPSPWSDKIGDRKRSQTGSSPNIWDVFRTRERHKHATPPPVSWLKFSITLVFAVGIAIKDGPASLFQMKDELHDENEDERIYMHLHQD